MRLYILFVFLIITPLIKGQEVLSAKMATIGHREGVRAVEIPDKPLTADTLLLPFTEDWSSGSFQTHGWLFPQGQANWSVSSLDGDPSPAARFCGLPEKDNYSFILSSAWIDGRVYRCADMYIEFDYKLVDYIHLGTEKLQLVATRDSIWTVLQEFTNNGSTGWIHVKSIIPIAFSHLLRVGFRVSGINSSKINNWYIDNISVYYLCKSVSNLEAWVGSGIHSLWLSWDTVQCYGPTLKDYIYDDGTWEDGYRWYNGNTGWFGNEFPLSDYTSGYLQSFSVYFVDNGTGSPMDFTIDVFNRNHELIGSTQTFTPYPDNWTEATANNIFFSGKFYAMVKWHNLPWGSYYLAMDEDGWYSTEDLEWAFDGTTWYKQSAIYGPPFVFFIRATAIEESSLKKIELSPEIFSRHGNEKFKQVKMKSDRSRILQDSMIVDGYNIFRSYPASSGPYLQLNTIKLTTPVYEDINPPCYAWWQSPCHYFIETVFRHSSDDSDFCVSNSDTLSAMICGTSGKHDHNDELLVYPNPASENASLSSEIGIEKIQFLSVAGESIKEENFPDLKKVEISLTDFHSGIYILKITAHQKIIYKKLIILK